MEKVLIIGGKIAIAVLYLIALPITAICSASLWLTGLMLDLAMKIDSKISNQTT